jgi:hypothetical protein
MDRLRICSCLSGLGISASSSCRSVLVVLSSLTRHTRPTTTFPRRRRGWGRRRLTAGVDPLARFGFDRGGGTMAVAVVSIAVAVIVAATVVVIVVVTTSMPAAVVVTTAALRVRPRERGGVHVRRFVAQGDGVERGLARGVCCRVIYIPRGGSGCSRGLQ